MIKLNKTLKFALLIIFISINIGQAQEVKCASSQELMYMPFVYNGVRQDMYVKSSDLDLLENNTKITGVVPRFTGANAHVKMLNEQVINAYKKQVEAATSQRAKNVVFDYEIYKDSHSNYLSVVMTSKIINATTKTEVSTFTVDLSTGKIMTLEDFTGENTIDVLSSYTIKMANENENSSTGSITFKSINENTDFYIEKGQLYLIFDSYTFYKNYGDLYRLLIPIDTVNTYVLPSNEYYTKKPYNIKMVELRDICENFGFEVTWDDKTKSIRVKDSSTVANLVIGSNVYIVNGQKLKLEVAPEIYDKDSKTYVPITFFNEALNIQYSIDNNMNITFYKF